MGDKRAFGELELAILRIFKGSDRLTVRDVLERLRSEDKYTTVMTVMSRLVEKKVLRRERTGQHYEYWVNESGMAAAPSFLNKWKEKIFGGRSASMVSYLLESSEDITDTELAEMEKLIKEMRQSRK